MPATAATLAMLAAAVSHAATQLWPQEHAAPRDSPFAFAHVDKLRRRRDKMDVDMYGDRIGYVVGVGLRSLWRS